MTTSKIANPKSKPAQRTAGKIQNPNFKDLFIKRAKDLGFIAVGLSRPQKPIHYEDYIKWISGRKNADMAWMERHLEIRADPTRLLKGCRTVISLAYPYSPRKPRTPDNYTVSRYSQPDREDYHYRLKALCQDLIDLMGQMESGTRSRICVDSAPVLEKSFACTAGIGFIGKNNMLLIPGYGSYFYLAEILTTLELPVAPPPVMDPQCGSCRLCVDACPTGALEKPYSLDASRCLAYLTIEYEGKIPGQMNEKMGDCFFGCDRCQEACPFNQADCSGTISLPATDELLGLDADEFKRRFGRTAFARAGLEKLKSNIRAVRRIETTGTRPSCIN
ncbi:MAG: tRNA epoxyqueuosine(34) reductase QueG [Deltaproteobacteria bacterium]|nr:tRNA epoxyqueuosine(34) reductase QueG [Deltaproteobacteria bacterium]